MRSKQERKGKGVGGGDARTAESRGEILRVKWGANFDRTPGGVRLQLAACDTEGSASEEAKLGDGLLQLPKRNSSAELVDVMQMVDNNGRDALLLELGTADRIEGGELLLVLGLERLGIELRESELSGIDLSHAGEDRGLVNGLQHPGLVRLVLGVRQTAIVLLCPLANLGELARVKRPQLSGHDRGDSGHGARDPHSPSGLSDAHNGTHASSIGELVNSKRRSAVEREHFSVLGGVCS